MLTDCILYFSPVLHLKSWNKHLLIYLPQHQQVLTVLFVGMEALCEKAMQFVLDGAECS